jgi:hypothetical protein
MTERDLHRRVVYRAKRRGWTVAHVGKGYVGGEGGQFVTQVTPGWPDLILFNPQGKPHKVIAMELKREKGILEDNQVTWLSLFNACGIPGIVVRPSNLRLGHVEAILDGKL